MNLCFLDLETTGFEPTKDSIIECSLVRFEGDVQKSEIDQVYKPDKSGLSDFVMHLTGITQEELDAKGMDFTEHAAAVKEAIGDAVIVGHNIDFDIKFLIENGVDLSQNPRIDTHELARILMPGAKSFALEVLSQDLGFVHKDAHRAMSDVLASKDLYEYLCERIVALPSSFLSVIRPFLETQTDWYARALFLETKGLSDGSWDSFRFEKSHPDYNFEPALEPLTQAASIVRIDQHNKAADYLIKQAESHENPSLIISPKLTFFESVDMFPTPEVLFDRDRLDAFLSERGTLKDADTTFYLKCLLRHECGYRGLFQFDLFFLERELWKEVCIKDENDPKFKAIADEKSKHKVLALSPEAFLRFKDWPIFKDRTLLIDEAEFTAEKLLQYPTKAFSLKPFLNHKEEAIAHKMQFIVTRFCREVIEPLLGHTLSPFPQKITLTTETFSDFLEDLTPFFPEGTTDFWTTYFTNPEPSHVRWLTYFPEGGNIVFSDWDPQVWRDLKSSVAGHQLLLAHRAAEIDTDFWPLFYGIVSPQSLSNPPLSETPKCIVPQDLISVKSPDFNDFTAHKMKQIFEKSDHGVLFNFSSLETMRGIFDTMNQDIAEDVFFTGERIAGGDGKLMEMLHKNKDKRMGLCYQRIMRPGLADFDFQTLVIQKFPFSPPHPLLQAVESKMKESGKNFWNLWIIPQMAANISRRMGSFPHLKEVYFLDPRENSRWGKTILEKVF